MALTQVSGGGVKDGSINNVDINASAAIAGSKVTPDFGSQNVTTTGTVTGASLIPGGSTVPTLGLYQPSAGVLGVATGGSGRLFIDSNGNVGVGVASPSVAFDCNGAVRSSTGVIQANSADQYKYIEFMHSGTRQSHISWDNTNNWLFVQANAANSQMLFSTNNSEKMRITSAGLVGVGTSSPTARLESSQNIGFGTGGTFAAGQLYSDANWGVILSAKQASPNTAEFAFQNAGGTERFRVTGTGTFNIKGAGDGTTTQAYSFNGSAPVNSLVVNSSGQVGIGTASPAAALDVNGAAKIGAATGDAQLEIGAGASGNRNAYVDLVGDTTYTDFGLRVFRGGTGANTTSAIEHRGTGELRLIAQEAAPIAFRTTNQERMRITSDGEVLIGRTTFAAPDTTIGVMLNPTGFLTLTSSAEAGSFNRQGSDGTVFQFRRANTIVGSIGVTATATSYATSSDYRLKKNVTAVIDGITRLRQLKPSRFNFIATPDKTVDGFLAHEVQDVVPEAITGTKDEVDADGNPIYQGIDQSKLVPLLTAALQEAIAKIETLEAKVAALEAA